MLWQKARGHKSIYEIAGPSEWRNRHHRAGIAGFQTAPPEADFQGFRVKGLGFRG